MSGVTTMNKEKQTEAAAAYVMPPVAIGDIVLHYQGKGADPVAALVTGVGGRSLLLCAFAPFMGNGKVIDGARHRSDPDLTADNSEGFWEFTDRHYRKV